MQSQSNRRKVVVASIVFLIVFIVVALVITGNKKTDTKVDDPSGEVISDPKNREPETFGVKNEITYYGTSQLLDSGFSAFMLDTFKQEVTKLSEANGDYIDSLSVYKDSIRRSETDTATLRKFKVKINHTTDADVVLTSTGIMDVQISVIDATGSKIINTTKIIYKNPADEFTGDGIPPEQQ